MMTVTITINNHFHDFHPKLINTNNNRKRYNGNDTILSLKKGNILFQNGEVHCVLILRNNQVSHSFNVFSIDVKT